MFLFYKIFILTIFILIFFFYDDISSFFDHSDNIKNVYSNNNNFDKNKNNNKNNNSNIEKKVKFNDRVSYINDSNDNDGSISSFISDNKSSDYDVDGYKSNDIETFDKLSSLNDYKSQESSFIID